MTSLDPWTSDDRRWMSQVLELAERAATVGEVPIGAVVVRDGMCLGEGYNQPITNHDPSAHAEMVAIRNAGRRNDWHLLTLVSTLSPCIMCTGTALYKVKR